MTENSSNVEIGYMSHITAKSYNDHGKTESRVKVQDGGRYTRKTKIKAKEYHHHEHSKGGSDALNNLRAHIAAGALHNSDERVDAPKCHEDTREAVQRDIFSCLIAHGHHSREIVWLTGPAGAGKTAIMGTVCDRLKEQGQLAATFYFSSHKGSVNRHSKRSFVTTLAYQLHRHSALKDRISPGMMCNIQEDPALFEMSLKEQVEVLILQPLRASEGSEESAFDLPLVIAVDAIDECGEDQYNDSNRSREQDQIEVLSVILQAAMDPSFPCRIIVASRPEKWIRRFFDVTAAGHVVEIFLDDKYRPDDDIKLYLKSNFARLCREHGYDPSTWPREEGINKLVTDASGQFIYAATVLRFIDSAWPLPKEQLDVVLQVKPPAGSSPFRALDALYITIVNSSPSPQDTILWLKAIDVLNRQKRSVVERSVWTIDRLFEASSGQSRMILGLPSLVYMKALDATVSDFISSLEPRGIPPIRPVGCHLAYSFYHKSFLDFLGDPARSGAAFPGVTNADVVQWIWERISKVLECKDFSSLPAP